MARKKKPVEPLSYIAEELRPLAVPIETLVLDPKNARKHNARNLKAIETSLKRFGQRIAIVVQRDGMIVRAGNGRVLAAKELGWTHIAAVMVDDANPEAVAFALTDNRTAELAEWDDDVLADLLKEIGDEDAELMKLMEDLLPVVEPEIVEDEVPAVPVEPITKPGDLWLLGDVHWECEDCGKRYEYDEGQKMKGVCPCG